MKQEVFIHILDKLRNNSKKIDDLYDLGIDLINFSDDSNEVTNILFKVYYGQEGADWIDWYLYERAGKADMIAYDCDKNPICYDDESLWKEVEQCRLDNKKEYELPKKISDAERDEILNMLVKEI